MYPYKKMRGKLFFDSRESEIGDVFLLTGVDDDIVRHCFNVEHIVHSNFFNLTIAFYEEEVLGYAEFLFSGIEVTLRLIHGFQESRKGDWL